MAQEGKNQIEEISRFSEVLPLGLIFFDKEFNIIDCNDNLLQFPGISLQNKDELIGKKFSLGILGNSKNSELLEKDLPFEENLTSTKTSQGILSVTLKVMPLYDENEVFEGGVAVLEDHLFQYNDIEKDPSERISSIAKYYHDAFYISQEDGKILYSSVNDEVKQQFNNNPANVKEIFENSILNKEFKLLFNQSKTGTKVKDYIHSDEYLIRVVIRKEEKFDLVISAIDLVEAGGAKYTKEEIEELEKFHVISESIVDSIFGTDENGIVDFWNKGAEKIFGFPRSSVFGKHIQNVIPTFDSEYFANLIKMIDDKGVWESELKLKLGGEDKFINLKMTKVELRDKSFVMGIASDETLRARVERELRISEERYRNLVTNSAEFILLLDDDGKINYVNPAFLSATNEKEEKLIGVRFIDLFDQKSLNKSGLQERDILKKDKVNVELPLKGIKGNDIIVLANITPFLDLNGDVKYFTVVMTDITEKKTAEKDMLLIRSVFDASNDGIAVIKERKISLCNDSFAKLFNFNSIKDALGTDPADLVSQDDIVEFTELIQKIESGKIRGGQIEFSGLEQKGERRYFSGSVTSYDFEEEKYIVLVARDETQSKKAEILLKQSEERYRNITDTISDVLWMAERVEGKLQTVFYTSSIQKLLGYSSDEFIEKKNLWYRVIHPKDRNGVIKQLKGIYSNPELTEGELEYRVVTREGNILWIANKLKILRNDTGEIESIIGVVSDITLNKRAEEELRKSAEELANLNESKDRFISIISHDLRTPFSSILGYTDLLLGNRELPETKQVEYISFIQESAKNMLDLVNSLLDWTRLQTGRIKFEPQKIDASLLANKCINILGGTALQKNITLVSNVNRQIYIHADENLMMQVLNNLVSNAIKFTNPGGSITINANPKPEEHVVQISVKDTGTGIRKEDMDKLFRVDAKFTSPGTAGEKGTGLGLSLVKEIVEKHGGKIWVRSKLGHGTEFIFTVPVSSSTILLVDDLLTDRILYRKLIQSILPEFTIKDAPNGKAAVEAIKNLAPLLVITEHNLPMLRGEALIKQVQIMDEIQMKPAFIVLTRDYNEKLQKAYNELGVKYIFGKPVELDKFRIALINSMKETNIN